MDPASSLLEEIRRIAGEVAAPAAAGVDRDARFPAEAIAALREAGALGAAVPAELGGGGLGLAPIARACAELAASCAATGMIFAMHQIQVVCIARHLDGAPWFERYLRRVAAERRLIASATSEQGTGGDISRSIAALEPDADGSRLSFEKLATTISYGAQPYGAQLNGPNSPRCWRKSGAASTCFTGIWYLSSSLSGNFCASQRDRRGE